MRKYILVAAAATIALAAVAIPMLQADDEPAPSDQIAQAEPSAWEVVPAPTDGPPFPAASVLSDDGYRLYLWSRTDERGRQVFAELHAPADVTLAGTMPVWQIDDEPAMDADDIRLAGESQGLLWGFATDRVTIWMIWLGQGDIPESDPAHDWFHGEILEVTVELAAGEKHTVEFPLAGARAAIEEAVEIRPQQASAGS
jgi:hypothetical protein